MSSKQRGSPQDALQRALRFLGYCPRSEAEVRLKLSQLGFSSAITEATIRRLNSLGYLDDEKVAQGWVRSRVEGRGYGPLRVERELRARGIKADLLREVLRETFQRDRGAERASALLHKRFHGKDLRDKKMLRRAVSFLRRRGYHDSVIAEVLKLPADE